MRIIPTKVHGMLDYIVGVLLIAAPWLFNFDRGGAETWVPVVVGVLVLLQAIMTDYEAGVIHKISMVNHLRMDFILGVILAASPWIFNFSNIVWAPHVIVGIFSIIASIMTKTVPDYVHKPHTDFRTHHTS